MSSIPNRNPLSSPSRSPRQPELKTHTRHWYRSPGTVSIRSRASPPGHGLENENIPPPHLQPACLVNPPPCPKTSPNRSSHRANERTARPPAEKQFSEIFSSIQFTVLKLCCIKSFAPTPAKESGLSHKSPMVKPSEDSTVSYASQKPAQPQTGRSPHSRLPRPATKERGENFPQPVAPNEPRNPVRSPRPLLPLLPQKEESSPVGYCIPAYFVQIHAKDKETIAT